MLKKTFINEERGWPEPIVEYLATTPDGTSYRGWCIKSEWEAYLLMEKLVDAGADGKIVEELYQKAYEIGEHETSMYMSEDESL